MKKDQIDVVENKAVVIQDIIRRAFTLSYSDGLKLETELNNCILNLQKICKIK